MPLLQVFVAVNLINLSYQMKMNIVEILSYSVNSITIVLRRSKLTTAKSRPLSSKDSCALNIYLLAQYHYKSGPKALFLQITNILIKICQNISLPYYFLLSDFLMISRDFLRSVRFYFKFLLILTYKSI